MALAFGIGAVRGLQAREDIEKRFYFLVGIYVANFASFSMHLRLPNALPRHVHTLIFP